jgi:diguanylate cyclase
LKHIIQLGLNKHCKSNSNPLTANVVWLLDQILELIAENQSDLAADAQESFRSQLQSPRDEIQHATGDISETIARTALDLCRSNFDRIQLRRFEKDEEFTEIINFLRKSLANLTGDSRSFHENLLHTTDRIKGLSELKDIQEFKRRIAAEVGELSKIVLEKQKRDQIQHSQLSDKVAALQRKLEAARTEAALDGLTGIANRRSFDFAIQRWVRAHEKNEEPFTVAFFDLDNFKKINDNYGHPVGDQVLAFAAMELSKNIRTDDFIARYGGEEFVILSERMRLADTEKRFSEVLSQIEKKQFQCNCEEKGSLSISITASCGVAEYALGESAGDLIGRADEALYQAKKQGKNRVAIKRRPLLGAFYEGRKRNTVA